MIKTLIKLELFVLSIIFAFSFAGLPAKRTQGVWTSCYDAAKQSLHFQAPGVVTKTCGGKTKFKAPISHHLITNILHNGAFSEARAGTKRSVLLNDGRQIMVSQWSQHARTNDIYVLEPNFYNNSVKKHCRIENYNDAFDTRYNQKTNTLYVQVERPINRNHTKFKQTWKACKL